MFNRILKLLGLRCKHKDKILVGHSYSTYVTDSVYDHRPLHYTTETYRHFVCKKCNEHVREVMVRYAPNYEKEDSEKFEERLRNKGILRTEDILLEVDKVRYGETASMKAVDKNKTF